MTTKSSGFTLIELLVVVAILGTIASIGVLSYNGYISSSKKKQLKIFYIKLL
jgi:prepilin-type N-terminal cleavage/methylation domain-containing protein